jgi:hypothetical protein
LVTVGNGHEPVFGDEQSCRSARRAVKGQLTDELPLALLLGSMFGFARVVAGEPTFLGEKVSWR